MQWTRIAGGDCPDGKNCPAGWDNGEPTAVYMVGTPVDAATVGLADQIGPGEVLIRFPRDLWNTRAEATGC